MGEWWRPDVTTDRLRWRTSRRTKDLLFRTKSPASVVKLAFGPETVNLSLSQRGTKPGKSRAARIWEYRTPQKPVLVSEDFTWGILELAWPLQRQIVAYSGHPLGLRKRTDTSFRSYRKAMGIMLGKRSDQYKPPHVVESHFFQTWVAEDVAALVIHDRSRASTLVVRSSWHS